MDNNSKNQIDRFERYNLINELIPYCKKFSLIKLALDSFLDNKIHRKIQYAEEITVK